MKRTIGRRLVHLAVILLGVSFLTFLLMYISPGDPAQKKLTAQGIAVSPEVLEAARREMGLDRPFLVQYGSWLANALRGDLGASYRDGLPVAGKLAGAMGNTLMLALVSLTAALLVSLPLAVWTAVHRDGIADRLVRLFSFVGNSLPNFLLSVLLMYLFCIRLRLLPVIADGSVRGLLLPCLTLAVLTVAALSVGTLLGGSVVIESMFRWPGLGKLAMDAISARDYPVLQGFVLVTAAVYVLVNLAADLLCFRADPRMGEEVRP
mgnify:CR=1 FL=1